MTKPAKVAGFLDLGGAWDASLALVMLGAIAVHFVAFRLITRRKAPLFDAKFHVPSRRDITLPLVFGAAIFGVGWGLGGFCPGPGIVAAGAGSTGALVFVAGMTGGVLQVLLISRVSSGPRVSSATAKPYATESEKS
jgi:uncharacterized membrane protein YedE/YeeE